MTFTPPSPREVVYSLISAWMSTSTSFQLKSLDKSRTTELVVEKDQGSSEKQEGNMCNKRMYCSKLEIETAERVFKT